METSPLVCGANQWIGFYMIAVFALKGLSLQRTLGIRFDRFQHPKDF